MELLSELTPWTPKAIARSVEAHHWPPPTYWIRDMLTDIASAWAADRKAMWAAYNLLERADHQYYDSEAEAILGAALRSGEER